MHQRDHERQSTQYLLGRAYELIALAQRCRGDGRYKDAASHTCEAIGLLGKAHRTLWLIGETER